MYYLMPREPPTPEPAPVGLPTTEEGEQLCVEFSIQSEKL